LPISLPITVETLILKSSSERLSIGLQGKK
jgi:hypothetical protein